LNRILQIDVAMLPSLMLTSLSDPKVQRGAVVIDTLRFTTTASQALHVGAESIQVAQEIDAAMQLGKQIGSNARLCGERHCKPIPGFHFGNSPLEYTAESVAGAKLVFSTTNGTRAVEAVADFNTCLLGSLVNRQAIARAIAASSIDRWSIVCAGTDGQVAGEDLLAAGAILDSLTKLTQVELAGDSALIALSLWQASQPSADSGLASQLEKFSGGFNLVQAGYRADIRFAAKLDALDVVPCRFGESFKAAS
jgi:2-phosphosulfolactate phosphatase